LTKREFKYSDYTISIYPSINDCQAEWNAFKSDFLSGDYLKVLEKSNPSDLYFRYIVVSNSDKEICGIIYFQLLKFSGKNVHLKSKPVLTVLVNLALKIRTLRVLICGNVFAVNFRPFAYDPIKITESDLFKIVEQYTLMEKSDAILLKDFGTDKSSTTLYSMGFQNYTADLTMCLDVRQKWKSIDDYKNSLSKKYRKRFEKITSAGSEIERRELTYAEIIQYREELYKLFKQVSAKQTIAMGLIDKNYFEEFKNAFPDKFKVVGYFDKKTLIAFTSYIDRDELLEVHYIGMNYELNEKYNLYFNILFDSTAMAIQQKKQLLELGRTAREAKANLGCKAVYFNDYMKLNSKYRYQSSRLVWHQLSAIYGTGMAKEKSF
jgi:hypothetical protein